MLLRKKKMSKNLSSQMKRIFRKFKFLTYTTLVYVKFCRYLRVCSMFLAWWGNIKLAAPWKFPPNKVLGNAPVSQCFRDGEVKKMFAETCNCLFWSYLRLRVLPLEVAIRFRFGLVVNSFPELPHVVNLLFL